MSQTYSLLQDIDCTGVEFVPIANLDNFFNGKLFGNGFTIKNLTINCTCQCCGLFEKTGGATISNLVFKDFSIQGNSKNNVGVLAGRAYTTTISNVTITSSTGGNVTGNGIFHLFFYPKLFSKVF